MPKRVDDSIIHVGAEMERVLYGIYGCGNFNFNEILIYISLRYLVAINHAGKEWRQSS